MPRSCLLIPIEVDKFALTPLWVLIWPAPNLRTHLEHREQLQPSMHVVTVPPPHCVRLSMGALQYATAGEPTYFPLDVARLIARHCSVPSSQAELTLIITDGRAVATVRHPHGTYASRPFALELLDPLSPRHHSEVPRSIGAEPGCGG